MPLTLQMRKDLILWDVVEEHLDEAEFLLERWNRALYQPTVDLAELAGTFEPRLLAHLDALLVGGIEVAEQVLFRELHAPKDSTRTTVAALALLSNPEGLWIEKVTRCAQQSQEPFRGALIRALVLSDCPILDLVLPNQFQRHPDDWVLLEILTGRGLDPGRPLQYCLESRDPKLVFAARKAVRRFGRRELFYLARIDSGNDGSRLDLYEWNEQLKSPASIESALWRLGFCGTVEAGDLCASYLQSTHPRLVKLAFDSIAWIGGLHLADPQFKLSPQDAATSTASSIADVNGDGPSTFVELDGVDDIPLPDGAAIERWWGENRGRFSAYRRCLLGKPFSIESVRFALRAGPLWRRHSLALEVCAQSDGRMHVSTDAFSSRQFRQLASLGA